MIAAAAAAIVAAVLAGLPLFAAFSAAALLGLHSIEVPLPAFLIEVYRLTSAPALLAVPLFTLAGVLFANSKAPGRIVGISDALIGWIPGGLSLAAVAACAVFTAFTGASGVTIVALGGLLLPALEQQKYPERFSLGLLTTSGSIGLLFPPSLPVILYGLVAKTDVDALFRAAFFPGLLLVLSVSTYCAWFGYRGKQPRTSPSWARLRKALRAAVWELPLPLIVLGGIYGGVFTATEAAAITAAYALIVEVFIYRDIHWRRDLPGVVVESAVLMGGILIILSAALGFTNYLVDQEVPMKILEAMRGFLDSRVGFLLLLNAFLIVVGCMLDIFSAIVVVVPLIVPIAESFHVNPLHLGVVFLANLEIGYSTPPVGINLFLSSMRFRKPVGTLYRSVVPFLMIHLAVLAAITYIPLLFY